MSKRTRLRTTGCLAIAGLVGTAAIVPASAEAGCSNFRHRAKVEFGPGGPDLAYLNISKRICRNGRRITTKNHDISVRPQITKAGGLLNLKFEGYLGDEVSNYGSWRGVGHARWYGYSAAQFSFASPVDVPKVGTVSGTLSVSVSMTVYGNHADYRNTKKRQTNWP